MLQLGSSDSAIALPEIGSKLYFMQKQTCAKPAELSAFPKQPQTPALQVLLIVVLLQSPNKAIAFVVQRSKPEQQRPRI